MRLSFGVSSAPAIFQRTMEALLKDLPMIYVYIDDILVTGKTLQDHLNNLTAVLNRWQDASLRLKREKCSFCIPNVEYLGHVISAEGLKALPRKVAAVVDAPLPTKLSDLKAFLGLLSYYTKFLLIWLPPLLHFTNFSRKSEVAMEHRTRESLQGS